MALTSSGQISILDLKNEFITTSSYTENFDLNDFYHADPYAGVPLSGELSLDDFYSTNSRTCEIDGGASFDDSWDGTNTDPDPAGRRGFSLSNGSAFYAAEAGESRNAFGTVSKSYGLLSTGQQFTGFFLENTSQIDPFVASERIVMFKRGGGNSSTSAGWDSIKFRMNSTHNSRWFQSGSLKQFTLYRTNADDFFKGSNTLVSGVSAYGWFWRISGAYGNTGSGATNDEIGIWQWLRSISGITTSSTTGYQAYGDGGQGNYAALQFVGGTSPVATQYYKSIKYERTTTGNVTTQLYIYTRMNGTTLEIYARGAIGATGVTYYTQHEQGGGTFGATVSQGHKIAQITNAGSGEWYANIGTSSASGPSGWTTIHSTSTNMTGNIPAPPPSTIVINNSALWYNSLPTSTEYKGFKSVANAMGTQAEPQVNTVKHGSRITLYLKHAPTSTTDTTTTNAHDDIEFEFDIYTMARSTGP